MTSAAGYARTVKDEAGERSVSEALVAANAGLWEAMAAHPWVRGLADGTLPRSALVAWAGQCGWFAAMERRALQSIRALLPPGELDGLLARLVGDTEREPRELADLLAALGEPVPPEPWPACLGYASYVQARAHEGLLTGLTAIHAVERAYLDTWSSVAPMVSPSSPWRAWVENWTSPAFRSVVDGIGAHLDEAAGPPSLATLDRLAPVYRQVALFEHAFWEMAWRGEGWPAELAVRS